MATAAELAHNREVWEVVNRQFTDEQAESEWRRQTVTWGIFHTPEAQVDVLGEVRNLDVIELGCGTGFFGAGLARLGARVVGVDLSLAQLRTARRCQTTIGPPFPLLAADASAVPLADDSFDLAVSEYGASLWCDPREWLPEAARLLRPGGRLVFLTCSVLVTLCVPDAGGTAVTELQRAQAGKFRVSWAEGGIEYHPSHGDWIRLLQSAGFTVEGLHELYAPTDAQEVAYYEIADPAWAQRWPVEDLWVAQKNR